MATPWVTVIGWLATPIIGLLVIKLFSYLGFDVSRELEDLEFITVPELKLALVDVTEKRMMREIKKDEGRRSEYDLTTLQKWENRLKSALDDAEGILDLEDYHRIKKEAIGDTSIWKRLHDDAVDDCITYCNASWCWQRLHDDAVDDCITYCKAKLEQYAQRQNRKDLLAKLQQSLKQQLTQQGSAADSQTPPDPDAPSTSSTAESIGDVEQGSAAQPPLVEMIRCSSWSRQLNISSCYRCVMSWTTFLVSAVAKITVCCQLILVLILALSGLLYSLLCSCLNWSYEVMISIQKDGSSRRKCLVPVTERTRLRKQIKRIQGILTDTKKSDLLAQKSSSTSNGKETDKEGGSSSSKHQKEIDDLNTSIEHKVFGRDKDRLDISRMLREGPYHVIAMHGITGSGKSTLAQYVCNYEKHKGHFNSIMFIHVRKTFSLGDIFRDMLEQINPNRPSSDKDLKSLKKELEEKLKDKCFLLVLDDLWTVGGEDPQGPRILQEQAILLDVLRAGQSGSRILVTAQTKDSASGLGTQEQILIQDLEEEEYLKLFMHHALQGAVDDDGRFERFGRSIAKKLHRSPIAAVAVGRRLQAEKSISSWETTANLDVLNETMGALWWSYQKLCADTRRCFQYCSTFPKGYKFDRSELVHSWIAHGFVNTMSNAATEELEDVGERCLQELLKFSFLQVRATMFQKEEFTIHDLLHHLAERVAGSDFFRIDGSMGFKAKDIPPDIRHLFIETRNIAQLAQISEKKQDLGNLHTLIINNAYVGTYTEQRRHDLEKILDRLFRRLMKLQVLIIRLGCISRGELSFPASIGQMKHLRYISFHCHLVYYDAKLILPSTFSKLYQMQTMFLHPETVSYPDGMGNLIRLRHGWLSGAPNIGRMTSLQTMRSSFKVKKEQGHELKQLEQLNKLRGTLEIFGLENVGSKEEALEADLASKKRVTNLGLHFFDGSTKNPDIEAEVLEVLCPPKDLQELTIQGYRGSRYPSWMLSGKQHPEAPKHLRRLALIDCGSPLASFPEDSELFMNLRELRISGWEQDSLPENMERLVWLQSLSIARCGHSKSTMVTLPRSLHKIWVSFSNVVLENLEHLVSLEDLSISYCDKMEVIPTLPQSLKKIEISWCRKVEVIPTLPQSLKKIRISRCDKVKVLPTLPQSVKEIHIYGEVLGRSCEDKEHENWRKIQHIGLRYINFVRSQDNHI